MKNSAGIRSFTSRTRASTSTCVLMASKDTSRSARSAARSSTLPRLAIFWLTRCCDTKYFVSFESASDSNLTLHRAGRDAAGRPSGRKASTIAGYVSASDKLDKSLCRFARAYADQTEAGHQALVKAVARSVLPVEYWG